MRGEVDEVVDAELFEGSDEVVGGALGFGGVGVGFELVFPGPGIREDTEQAADRAEEDTEENESDVGRDLLDSEGIKELAREGSIGIDDQSEKIDKHSGAALRSEIRDGSQTPSQLHDPSISIIYDEFVLL